MRKTNNVLIGEMNRKETKRIKQLLEVINNGESGMMEAINEIVVALEVYGESIVGKFTRRISTYDIDRDDLRQEFLFGAYMSIESTSHTVGDPMRFIIQKGTWALIDRLRKSYRLQVRQYCHDCNLETAINRKGGEQVCKSCGSNAVETINKHKHEGPTNDQAEGEQASLIDGLEQEVGLTIDQAIASQMVVDNFYAQLNGRKKEVFDLVYYQGYDRDNCQNYIKEVAEIMGVTPQNVNLRLRQIKQQWKEYAELQAELDELEEKYDYER
jgi:RNA polymerase sigma factor (sigma-70 family)